ncbi:MAG: hypothetical protein O3A46_13960 [Candidatus Poribacteria bacterium]|nr:hypothetical protein [Candidatus Poribacteria bacterium]
MAMWTKRSSRAFEYLTQQTSMPRVVRAPRPESDEIGERASDKILRIIESAGWDVHSDAELLDFLANVDVQEQVPPKVQELIAEVLFFCWELDQDE